MTLEESIQFLALVKLAFPTSYRDLDKVSQKATVNMWHKAFSNVPYPIIELALNHWLKYSKYPPTIADMYEELRKLHGEARLNVVCLEDGKERELYKNIMKATEQFTERNDSFLDHKQTQNLLNGVNQPLIEG